ncbi:terminase small subunit [Pseudomonas nitroreducens]|uniref:terminase small subunit n=1 Tax=Pseudomonas nitroreducens TaxID=46680 RepID=UPI00265B6DF7|nr:terminase small subunit [Pseudomonas nitroreducens]MCP1646982.1 phage terminase small subunit [Pseudomonas nitroreducens]MCP1685558.1 phage terminase small subunit [Pseudomonas nitroreducens]
MALTEQQRKFAEARMEGLSIRESAISAGCPEKSASQAGSRLEKHPNVLAHLARLKSIESETVPGSGRDAPPAGVSLGDEFYDDPKDLLKQAMNDRRLDAKTRIQAAVALLPFEHQKLGEGGKKDQKQQEAGHVVKGRFAPAAPPSPQMKLVK